jgi:hypothetical protein
LPPPMPPLTGGAAAASAAAPPPRCPPPPLPPPPPPPKFPPGSPAAGGGTAGGEYGGGGKKALRSPSDPDAPELPAPPPPRSRSGGDRPPACISVGGRGGVDAVDAVEWAAAMSCSRAFKTHAHPRLVCLKPNSTTKKRTREFKRRRICTCDALRLFPRALAYRGVSRRFDPVEGVHAPAPFFVAPARERTVFCVLGEVEVPSFLSRATS